MYSDRMTMNRGSNRQGSSMQNNLTDPVTLTFEPQNSTTSRVSQGHLFPTPSLNTLGSFVFTCVSYAEASNRYRLDVCLSVCHTLVLYQNG